MRRAALRGQALAFRRRQKFGSASNRANGGIMAVPTPFDETETVMLQLARAAGNCRTMRIGRRPAIGRRTGQAALLACLWGFWPWSAALADEVVVSVTNIKTDQGQLRIELFQREGWLQEEGALIRRDLPVAEHWADGAIATRFDAAPGKYAIVAFHDVNGNGELDTGFMRRPKEPTGFSNGVVPRFGPPRFEDCAFLLSAQGASLRVELRDY